MQEYFLQWRILESNLEHRGVLKLSLHIDTQMDIPALEEYIVEPNARADERYPRNRYAYRSRIFTWRKKKQNSNY